ncbi:MAG: peptidase M28 [Bacteroidetes bacterium]|nr:MAG: peptidase M28 [Bacteroidota bacterium]PTM10581.1 MAG: peptidase M28 [Bacteroidota bacterium]
MKNLFVLLLSLVATTTWGQMRQAPDAEERFANTITVEDLTRHLTVLASDEMEGRETGQPGQYRAARYLEEIIKGYGLPAIGPNESYSQPISFISERWKNITLQINGKDQRHLWDFYAYPSKNTDRGEVSCSEIVYLGYGIEDPAYNDYQGQDVTGKTILILAGEPADKKGLSLLTGTKEPSAWSEDVDQKLRAAHQHGVATVIILDPDFQRNLSGARKIALDSRMRMGFSEEAAENFSNSIFVSSETARQMLGDGFSEVVKARKRTERKGRPQAVTVSVDLKLTQEKEVKELLGENMLGYVEGSDPVLKQELVVVTAHYDHIGKRGKAIFNGADDNGSGTSTVLEVCQAFALAKQAGAGPRRSMLFMLVSGEEKGLLGSQFYVEHPLFPLENTVADINVDMVGRIDDKHAGNPNYIYVIGSDRLSTELHEINEAANAKYTQLELDYTYNAEDDPNRYYYRSDHYNFAERGIPAVFFFNGTHEDYHQATDTIDKINFEKMAAIGKLVFHTAWQLANQDKRIEVDVKP